MKARAMAVEMSAAGAASAATQAATGAGGAAMLGAGAGIAAGLSMLVVMLTKRPRTDQEWLVAIISTVVSSVCGGAIVILRFGLLRWVDSALPTLEMFVGLIALIGVAFLCGLPGWAVVRWVFNWILAREGKDIGEVIKDAKELSRDAF